MDAAGMRTVAVSTGDPAGIGPEVSLRAALAVEDCRFLLVGHKRVLDRHAEKSNVALEAPRVARAQEAPPDARVCVIEAPRWPAPAAMMGQVVSSCGVASIEYAKLAARIVIEGKADALVTAPISKEAVALAGLSYPGHTELLGEICGVKNQVMMLVGGGLRVAMVTAHVGLREVPGLLSAEKIMGVARVVWKALKADFAIPEPRVGILGLNPHASDGGRFGDEEKRLIAPAVTTLRSEGVNAFGPLVPDVAFWTMREGKFDALVCMYHDQGSAPLKTVAFNSGVNVTLGLPIVRTSPDHGTAFDIAGQGRADPSSMVAAVKLALEIAERRRA